MTPILQKEGLKKRAEVVGGEGRSEVEDTVAMLRGWDAKGHSVLISKENPKLGKALKRERDSTGKAIEGELGIVHLISQSISGVREGTRADRIGCQAGS